MLTTLQNVPGLHLWHSTFELGAVTDGHQPFSSEYHSAELKKIRWFHWKYPSQNPNAWPSITNGHVAQNFFNLWSNPGSTLYVNDPPFWPNKVLNSYNNKSAVRTSRSTCYIMPGKLFTNPAITNYSPNTCALQFLVIKRNGNNTSNLPYNPDGTWSNQTQLRDEEGHQTLIGAWGSKYGLEKPTEYYGYAIAADRNNNLMSKYSPGWQHDHTVTSNVAFPTTPSIITQFIFRGQGHGIRLNGENIANKALPQAEKQIAENPFTHTSPSTLQKIYFLIGAQASQWGAVASAEWPYYYPPTTVNSAEQDVYEFVTCYKDTPYTSTEVKEIEEFLGQKWGIPVKGDNLPLGSQTSIFDRFKRDNEEPRQTFRRLRLLGYF
jgi:hypothetical protein